MISKHVCLTSCKKSKNSNEECSKKTKKKLISGPKMPHFPYFEHNKKFFQKLLCHFCVFFGSLAPCKTCVTDKITEIQNYGIRDRGEVIGPFFTRCEGPTIQEEQQQAIVLFQNLIRTGRVLKNIYM